ncbi:hypothetical protein BJX96DRAFT_166010 [Aspergillus floccosus]
METTSVPNLVVGIVPDGDKLIKVDEYEDNDDVNTTNEPFLKQTGTFKVNSKTLAEESNYFAAMFRNQWRETSTEATPKHDTVKSIEVWLRVLHGTTVAVESVSISDVWYMIKTRDKYDVLLEKISTWFDQRFTHQKAKNHRQLLFPCYAFDHGARFQYLTKHLAYSKGGHITESNPTSLREMHLPSRVIQQLNAARGHLRNILHRDLFEETKSMINYGACVKIWSMEEVASRNSINKILEWLEEFDEEKMRDKMSSSAFGSKPLCNSCNRPWKGIVDDAIETVRTYFDGLCLDCMGKSKTVVRSVDDDCRVRHREPTHYFSFMGRREKRGLTAD